MATNLSRKLIAAYERALKLEKRYPFMRVDKGKLAAHVGCSPAFVTQVLAKHRYPRKPGRKGK
jgi:hypothetical protein